MAATHDDASREDEILARQWFYRLQLPSGRWTEAYIPDDVLEIHATRLEMLDGFLERLRADGPATTALDVACHEGFFALHLARTGFAQVVGLDIREENLRHATLLRDVFEADNLTFTQRDVNDLAAAELGGFDVVLMFGLLYHLENPVGALRAARTHARRAVLVETQVAPGLSGTVDWGSYRWTKQIHGAFAVIDETDQLSADNREANTVPISLVPSLDALCHVMRAVGFDRVEVLRPPDGAHEQLASGKRVVVAGYVDSAPSH